MAALVSVWKMGVLNLLRCFAKKYEKNINKSRLVLQVGVDSEDFKDD